MYYNTLQYITIIVLGTVFKKVSEYNQEILQSQTADKPMTPHRMEGPHNTVLYIAFSISGTIVHTVLYT